ncbi:MAG: RsmE family RNA methyltransferase [Pseudomonadota bacterium]
MSLPTFFHAELSTDQNRIELSADESSHALKARRLKSAQQVCILNGAGLRAVGAVTEQHRNRLGVDLISFETLPKPQLRISIATAVPKGDRQRTMVDMLTQHGVHRIIPLQCERSNTRFSDKLWAKWLRYATEACKQSQNPWLPQISQALNVDHLINWVAEHEVCAWYADQEGDYGSESIDSASELLFIIGPEGGFTEVEIDCLRQARLNPVCLAQNILRTETAAITAMIGAGLRFAQ